MEPSMFNVQVPVKDTDEVFLMNTLSDAQLLVSTDVSQLLDRIAHGDTQFGGDDRDTIDTLIEHGFVVESREEERRALGEYFTNVREDTEQMKVTVLTTLQCNFACDYCFQGDHGDYNKFAAKMSLDTARKVALWIEQRLDEVKPEKFHLTLFGGEPLLNLPVAYYLAERTHAMCAARGMPHSVSVITNGLLLTPEVVDRRCRTGCTASRSRSTATATRTTACDPSAGDRGRSIASSRTFAASRRRSTSPSAAISTRTAGTAIRRCSNS
jgi:uncharacterized protein